VIDEHDQVRRPGPDHPGGGDPLTGLPTRSMMEAAFALTPPGGATVVAIDLDRFRLVNQALGSSAANEVLRAVAGRILAVVGDNGEPTTAYTNGTTGGAAYAFALGSKLRREAQVTLLTYRDGVPVGLQPVTLTPGGEVVPDDYVELPVPENL